MAATRAATKSSSGGSRKSSSRKTPRLVHDEPLGERDITSVWLEYQDSRSEAIRNFLVEKYLHLVRYNAERIYARLPDEVDLDDLMSVGLFGLMDAISSFDLSRNVKFETYCAPRIRGAILDELRAMDWVPRLVRHRSAKVEQARQRIEMATGRAATDEEVAEKLGADAEEFDKILRDSSAVGLYSLTRRASSHDDDRESRDMEIVRDDLQSNPVRELQQRDLKELITKGLSRAERLIVVLYYFENMTMKEIGATLDLSESRVSQMHSSILLRLKSHMQHRTRELEPVE